MYENPNKTEEIKKFMMGTRRTRRSRKSYNGKWRNKIKKKIIYLKSRFGRWKLISIQVVHLLCNSIYNLLLGMWVSESMNSVDEKLHSFAPFKMCECRLSLGFDRVENWGICHSWIIAWMMEITLHMSHLKSCLNFQSIRVNFTSQRYSNYHKTS